MNNQNNHRPNPLEEAALDLLNRSIDGEISSSEQEELDRLLATSDELRDLKSELISVNQLLEQLPEIDPPEYLQGSIERQTRLPVQGNAGLKKPGFIGTWLNVNWLRTGFALAAGVVLTVGVYEMGSEPINVGDSASLSGTMVKSGMVDQQGPLLDSFQLDTDRLTGLIELRGEGDSISLDVQLKSDGPSEVTVNFSGRGLEFDDASRMQNPVETVSVVDGTIHLASSGKQHYRLSLRRTPGTQKAKPLELEFFTNSELIQKAELNISHF